MLKIYIHTDHLIKYFMDIIHNGELGFSRNTNSDLFFQLVFLYEILN